MEIKDAKFIKSATWLEDCPTLRDLSGDLLPEIAVAGRSNVGKSSLLNHLFRKKNLVRTSATPGKTQLLNFFTVDDKIAFVDLPGYGYAKVPPAVQKEWGKMIQGYLVGRSTLKALLFLFDIRRMPDEDDLLLLEWAKFHKIPVIPIFTKCDKVGKTHLKPMTEKILKAFGNNVLDCIHYSVLKNMGRGNLLARISEVV
jgi:GTP-binding protein